MALFQDIAQANIQALKDHDKVARSIYTIVYGKFKNESIDKGLNAKELPDEDCLRIIQKTIKELEEERDLFLKANRMENANELSTQIDILKTYLPKQLSSDEIRNEISKLEDKKIPSVMKHFKTNFAGQVDMSLVSKIAKEFN